MTNPNLSGEQFPDKVVYGNTWSTNPLPRPEVESVRSSMTVQPNSTSKTSLDFSDEEWVPTERVTSNQDYVRPASVDELAGVDLLGMEDTPPTVAEYKNANDQIHYDVIDGNHRMNAAARQGRLIMPARVVRSR